MELFTKEKTNWKYILIVLILAVVVGGGISGYMRYFNKEIISISQFPEIKKPEKPKIEEGITNWKTYRNEEYEFEIKYPMDWEIEKALMTPKPIVAFSPLGKGCFFIYIEDIPRERELKDYLRELDERREFNFGNQKEIEFLGLPAIQREEYVKYSETFLTTYVKKENLIFKFYFCSSLSPAQFGVTEEDRKLNNQILSTFRFLE
jgi:hypothetical protein